MANLKLRMDILETFIFSKPWYLAQILPLPNQGCQQLTAVAGSFLWAGHLEQIAWQELHSPRLEGGLQVSCLASRAQALLSKQICWTIGNSGPAVNHLAYWLGCHLAAHLPHLAVPWPHGGKDPQTMENGGQHPL